MDVARFVSALQPDTTILILTGSDTLAEAAHSDYDYMENTADPQAVLDRVAALLAADAPVC